MASTFRADMKRVEKLAKTLESVAKKALPHAVRASLNTTAFEARKEWVGQLDKAMVLRNKFTANSLRVEKVKGIVISTMQSSVGSVAPYMAAQEFGGHEASKKKHGVPIPTTTAAGQGMKAQPRTKQVQKKNWQSAIQLRAKVTGRRGRRNAVALALAEKSGGVAFLDLGKRKGLFRVTRTSKGRLRVRMIWDLSKKSVTQKPRPTLEPTLRVIELRAPAFQEAALLEQFRRRKILGY
jgi:hypothetical protein